MLSPRSRLFNVVAALVGLTLVGCGGHAEPQPPTPRSIPLLGANVYPESMAVHPTSQEIFVSSPIQGEIQRVVGDKAEVFIRATSSPELLQAFAGLAVDAPRDRLIAVNAGDFQTAPRSQIAVFDVKQGTLLKVIPIQNTGPVPHLLNDVAVDAAGNIYTTDLWNSIVWRIPADLSAASVFAPSSSFATPTPTPFGSVGLNGIVVAPTGDALIVSMTSDPHLYRIALPSGEVSKIQVQGGYPANGADGIVFANNTTLLVTQNTGNSLLTVKLSPDYRTGRLLYTRAPDQVQAVLSNPTSAERVHGDLYLANGQFSRQMTQDPVLPFELVAIPLSMLPLE